MTTEFRRIRNNRTLPLLLHVIPVGTCRFVVRVEAICGEQWDWGLGTLCGGQGAVGRGHPKPPDFVAAEIGKVDHLVRKHRYLLPAAGGTMGTIVEARYYRATCDSHYLSDHLAGTNLFLEPGADQRTRPIYGPYLVACRPQRHFDKLAKRLIADCIHCQHIYQRITRYNTNASMIWRIICIFKVGMQFSNKYCTMHLCLKRCLMMYLEFW